VFRVVGSAARADRAVNRTIGAGNAESDACAVARAEDRPVIARRARCFWTETAAVMFRRAGVCRYRPGAVHAGLRYPGTGGMGGGATREPAGRRCIRWHGISSVLVERRGRQAAGGVVSAWRVAVAGCVPPLLLPCSQFQAIRHNRRPAA
jgi:hypothetical protein